MKVFLFLDEYKPIYDIVFLEINMPYKNGIDIAKELRLKDKDVIIAFATDLAQMAVKEYKVDAVDFIIKPVDNSGLSISSDSRVFFFLFQ